jgi:lipopolysaccharide biosynthesis protein
MTRPDASSEDRGGEPARLTDLMAARISAQSGSAQAAAQVDAGLAPPITIFAHVFHLDAWAEMLTRLEALTLPYQLVVTSPYPAAELRFPRNAVETEFLSTPNLGRDIKPFLTAFEATRFVKDICLKIHTKKSLHRRDGDSWRQAIFDDLIGESRQVSRIAVLLRENPNIGLVSPNRHLVPIALFPGSNLGNLEQLSRLYEVQDEAIDLSKALFVAGSMFWFRSGALSALHGKDIEFEPECGQLDGTKAHAHERIFALLAERRGFVSVTADELKARDSDAYRKLTAAEKLQRDAMLLFENRTVVEISPILRPIPIPSGAQRLYRKLPRGFRRMVRRIAGLPY